jgi:hypothetical protein
MSRKEVGGDDERQDMDQLDIGGVGAASGAALPDVTLSPRTPEPKRRRVEGDEGESSKGDEGESSPENEVRLRTPTANDLETPTANDLDVTQYFKF